MVPGAQGRAVSKVIEQRTAAQSLPVKPAFPFHGRSRRGFDLVRRVPERAAVAAESRRLKAAVAWALGVGPDTSWRMFLGVAANCGQGFPIQTDADATRLARFDDAITEALQGEKIAVWDSVSSTVVWGVLANELYGHSPGAAQ